MPLVIICGHPASGKTTRAKALATALSKLVAESTNPAHKNLTVTVINDESIGLRRSAYAQTRSEKDARAAFSSAIKRELGRERIVIADGMNYIKGFRYQLYCEAKAMQTPSCCLHVATTPAHSQALNAKIESEAPGASYPSDLLDNLIFRFEEPSAFARWDSPLFTLPADDAEPPSEAIFYALVGGSPPSKGGADDSAAVNTGLKRVQPNLATVAPVMSDAGALQRVDGVCGATIRRIQESMAERGTDSEGSAVVGKNEGGADVAIRIPEGGFSIAALQRLRREFVVLIRANPSMGKKSEDGIRGDFADFVHRRTWEED